MAAKLYTNYKGRPVTTHSYSSGSTFRYCKRRYQLEKVKGWRQKEKRASQHFGIAVENAIKFHVDNSLIGGIVNFEAAWLKIKDIKDLKYTDKEGDWESLNRMGKTMIELFHNWWKTAGLTNPKWQLEYKKEVFPGDLKYAGLEFTSFIDLRVEYKNKPLIIDVKTAAHGMPENPALLTLDPQLADYAWATGIHDVAFLNLIKGGNTYKKGDRATVISTGVQYVVALADEESALLLSYQDFVQYEQEVKGVKGNALKAIKEKWEQSPAASKLPFHKITKCRIQFLTITIPEAIVQEAGEIEAQNIVDIVDADERDCWPQDGKGIRFPDNKCILCPMQGICTGDDKLRDETLINVKSLPVVTQKEEDWLDKLMGELDS